ncbi:hypothetical protein [Microtetraspora malaysiensis]|uniref:hypothetical protein n=1 Tax=Microtetraspora malaysiensis TaxID=161358 RepID=UPI003D8DB61A
MGTIILFAICVVVMVLIAAIIALVAFCVVRESGESRGKALRAAGRAFVAVLAVCGTLMIAAAAFRSWDQPANAEPSKRVARSSIVDARDVTEKPVP